MREILFKGFHESENGTQRAYYGGTWHNGEWVCGDLVHRDNKVYIFPQDGLDSADNYETATDTVCEFIGLTDKNGVKIFEGDILDDGCDRAAVEYGEFNCSCCNGVYGWTCGNDVDIRNLEGASWNRPVVTGSTYDEEDEQCRSD